MGKSLSPLKPETLQASAVEDLIQAKAIGVRIRNLRLSRSMALVELGKQTGLSASFLSQLETGRVIPTLRNLARISGVFKKDLSYFFRNEKSSFFRVSKSSNRVQLALGEKNAPFLLSESMSALIPDRSTIPCLAEFPSDGPHDAFVPKVFAGLEFIYILEGSLSITLGKDKEILETTDAAWISAEAKRQYEREGTGPAKAMIITFPEHPETRIA